MDAGRFDALARGLASPASRRAAGRFLAWLGLTGLLAQTDGSRVDAAKGKKIKKRKPKRNAFGCVDVGGSCKNGGQCCSGICRGRKRKKRCQAHDAGVDALGKPCVAGVLDICADDAGGGFNTGVACTSSADEQGKCFTTTGNAGYCAASNILNGFGCGTCTKDKDCERFCGAGAACVQCPLCSAQPGATACAGIAPDSCVF